jgi:hypothetical protein
LPDWTCTDFLVSRNAPPACAKPTGPRAIGRSCSSEQRCHSGYCFIELGSACGTCQPEITIGDSCAQSASGTSLVCEGANTTFIALAAPGQARGIVANQSVS